MLGWSCDGKGVPVIPCARNAHFRSLISPNTPLTCSPNHTSDRPQVLWVAKPARQHGFSLCR